MGDTKIFKITNKAGKIIADSTSTKDKRNQALTILNNWRSSHAYPLQIICSNKTMKGKRILCTYFKL